MSQLEHDIHAIVGEIIRVSGDRHTGAMVINLQMNQGGICRINVNIDKNLKDARKKLRSEPE